jgi:AraC-like DNA-binding protein
MSRALLSKPIQASPLTDAVPCRVNPGDCKMAAPVLDFADSLEQILTTLLLSGYPTTVNLAAEISGVSVRTLQRQLSQHDLSYSRLMDKVRYRLAVSWLNNPDIQLIEIAYALGFADPANFTHAFRRWSGMTPSQFRKQHADS